MLGYKFTNLVNNLSGEINHDEFESAVKTWHWLGYDVYLAEGILYIVSKGSRPPVGSFRKVQ